MIGTGRAFKSPQIPFTPATRGRGHFIILKVYLSVGGGEGRGREGGLLQGEIAFSRAAPTEQNNVWLDKKLLHNPHIVCLASL